jgi:OOP family OmpA-OmpF porin
MLLVRLTLRETMETSLIRNQVGLAVACALVAGFASSAAQAQQLAPLVPVAVAETAPQPAYEKVVLDANVVFAFDKSVLSAAGRDTLDSFVGRIQGIGSGTMTAIGYADRFGTDDYNHALSERRVATVKAYLISKGVEPTWMVRSSARGESQPTTKAGECAGDQSASTIACLQPDRHVFVELSGARIKQ